MIYITFNDININKVIRFWKEKYEVSDKYKFFNHSECEFFPCHDGVEKEKFNCLFCFCPLYALGSKCGGNFNYLESGVKDCSKCTLPHRIENYEYIMSKYAEIKKIAESNK